MKATPVRLMLVAILSLGLRRVAFAHVFFAPYALPVPFWMYLYACVAALIVSFAVVGYFAGASATQSRYRTWDLLTDAPIWQAVWRSTVHLLRVGAVACLLLTIVAGLLGTGDPAANINETLFWVVFLLGFTYLTAVAGNLFGLMNPWKVLVDWAETMGVGLTIPRFPYPENSDTFQPSRSTWR